jgi:hypothetical protein
MLNPELPDLVLLKGMELHAVAAPCRIDDSDEDDEDA